VTGAADERGVPMKAGVLVHESTDDVGVAVRELKGGEEAGVRTLDGRPAGTVAAREEIPLGHKIALRDLPAGHALIEYGRPIGRTVRPIDRGSHVHTHNLKSARWSGDRDPAASVPPPPAAPAPMPRHPSGRAAEDLKITGYRRPDGRFGVRNHVLILPVDDISNAAATGAAALIKGVTVLPHPYGRLQFGADLDLTFRTLAGTGRNPNVAAAVVIGIEPKWTERIVSEIAATGKPAAGFSIERQGDLRTIEQAARKAAEFVQLASEIRREPFPVRALRMSAKCGESDTTSGLAANPTVGRAFERLAAAGATLIFGETTEITGAEDIVAAQCADPGVAARFLKFFDDYQRLVESRGADLFGSQPTEGNIRGGLTTIEEKALGNIQKIGRCRVVGTLDKGEEPRTPGLHFMDSSSAAAEMVTLCAAAGSVVHFFPTGQGNVIGHPLVPVIKLGANPQTVATMSEHIDVDLSGLLRFELDLDGAADLALGMLERTVNGRRSAAEVLRHDEFVLTRLYESA